MQNSHQYIHTTVHKARMLGFSDSTENGRTALTFATGANKNIEVIMMLIDA
tara:strand:+ start:14347 stop:14499 length:153 start_codon:yes stop_codon:yes gene_type:complete